MSKTTKQDLEDNIEALQLKLIEENALIRALKPRTLAEFDQTGAQELRQHEATRDAIKEQIAFLSAKKARLPSTPTHRQKPKSTKQARVYADILKRKKRNPKLTNEEAIDQLAERLEDSQEAIRKAFYAEQKRLNEIQGGAVRAKRESEEHFQQRDEESK